MSAERVDPRRQCDGKVRHLSRRAARQARKVTPVEPGRHLTIYRCPWCGFVHLGTAWNDETDGAVADMRRRIAEREERLELEQLDELVVTASARVLGVSEDYARRLLAGELEEETDG
jgi:NMD protein affecting ribosome stability and mRNA decay